MYGRRATMKKSDMSKEMQQDAVNCADEALNRFEIDQDIAKFIKQQFDRVHGPSWNCIVGKNYCTYLNHIPNHFVFFYLRRYAFLLFRVIFDDHVRGSNKGTTIGSEINNEKICSICQMGQSDRDLTCRHSFHKVCLEK